MSKIKIGIIGVGSISDSHIGAYINNPDCELCAFCDTDKKILEEKAEKYNIKEVYTDYNEMLEKADIDAVSVCTWNSEHAPATIAALNAKKHVLCEKPMSVDAESAKKMQEAAEKNGKLLQIGFVRRHGNDVAIIKDFIDTDYFGEIYYGKATYIRRNGNPGGWFGDKSRSGGGPLIDLGVHVIDLMRYVTGNPKAVSVYGATFTKLKDRKNLKTPKGYYSASHTENDICDVEDMATAMIRFDNGFVLSVEASFSLNTKNDQGRLELFGTKGGVKLEPDAEFYSEHNGYMTNTTLEAKTSLDFGVIFQNEINHFIDCIKNGTKCIAPAEDGVEMMKILDAIYESARTGHEVIIK